ncbi:Fe-S cluster assembly sulfur transfer protein SufU [Oenococcus sp.]|uniref:Fe-S cluster assembly sulfur transfer protein SufU n=1 Tax=Oenococcus sp. TaxID=1979414 RepID=UPI0039EA00C5
MQLDKLNLLYRQLILENAAHPQHYGHLTNFSDHLMLRNPTCGDTIDVEMVFQAEKVAEIAFTGQGCTISQASASMMTSVLLGQNLVDAKKLIASFSRLIMGEPISDQENQALGDAAVLASVAEFPTRIRCATLAWHAADNLLDQYLEKKHE